MNLLLDTHTMIWVMSEPAKLSKAARFLLDDPANTLWVSVASLWEIVIKVRLGKLTIPGSDVRLLLNNLDPYRLQILPIRSSHLILLQSLPMIHRDPFDRILIAQSKSDGFPLVTVDTDIRKYDLETLW